VAQPPPAVLKMTLYRRNLPHLEKPGYPYFVTFKTMDDFILPPGAKWLVLNHCLHDNGQKYTLHSGIVMSTHVHLLFTPLLAVELPYRLATIMNGIKGASSHSVNKLLKRRGILWQDESMDRMVRTPEEFNHILLYIQQNAIETGVRHPDDYPWYWRESAQPGAAVPRKHKRVKDPWLNPK
jgi:REP element-mobilizing transposase RayT